jgi:excisionase family DNA binding protein
MDGMLDRQQSAPDSAVPWSDLVTVQEGAALLRISRSTVFRWLKAGLLRGYRLGGRRVWLRRSELAAMVVPRDGSGGSFGREAGSARQPPERPLSENERNQGLAAIEAAKALQERLLRERGGCVFGPAWQDIAEARRLRVEQLR